MLLQLLHIATIEAANGNGTITGTALTAINGTAAAVVQALTDLDADPTNFNSTLTGLLQLLISPPSRPPMATAPSTGTALTAINGTAAEIAQAIADLDADPTNFNSTSAGAETAADIATIEAANGNGTINGSALTAINGTYAEIEQALTDLDTDPTNFDSTLTAGAASATDITALEATNGNGNIIGSALTAISGTPRLLFRPLQIWMPIPPTSTAPSQVLRRLLISLPSRPPTATAPSPVRP